MSTQPEQYPECWVFDSSRRVYQRNADGRAIGGPIWREHWRKVTIVDSNRRSWITSSGKRIPKGGGRDYAFSREEIEQAAFVHDHKYRISEMVRACLDYDKIKKVAEIMGYKPEDKSDAKT